MGNWIVYKHIAPSGKVYIGITGMTPAQRWIRGNGYKRNPYFYKAIQKYGWDNFEHVILIGGLTKEEAIEVEIQLISHYKGLGLCYNDTNGGEGTAGYKHTEEWKKQASIRMKGRVHTPEMIQKRRETMLLHPYHPSEETKRKIGAAARLQDHTKASHIAAQKRSKALYLVDSEGNVLHEFSSQQDAARHFGVCDASVSNYIGKDKCPRWANGYIKLKEA